MGGAHGPVGVFALFADLAGTIRLEVVGNLRLQTQFSISATTSCPIQPSHGGSGFHEWVETEEMLMRLFSQFQEMRFIP